MNIDVHQHLWPASFIEALRARRQAPRLDGWTLQLAGEPDYAVDPTEHDLEHRTAQARSDDLALVIVSLSSPLGIEELPAAEGSELLNAYHEGALTLPPSFRAWAAASLSAIDPALLARQLDSGFVGLSLPATTLLDAAGYDHVAPLLEVLETRNRPLFVHPGPARPAARGAQSAPGWWPAVVDYVQQMHAAWYAFRTWGRPQHPALRVCFAMLAGLAPLHGERFSVRSGEQTGLDEHAYLDISSYGARAIDATVRVLGIDVLVNGSDRPYALPTDDSLGPAAQFALRSANPARLLDLPEATNDAAIPPSAQS